MSVRPIQRGAGTLPVYIQISTALRRDIQSFYRAGEMLPSESELAALYSVNRHTLRRAVDELVADGIVERQHGRGVCVLAPTIDYCIGQRTRFTENLETLGVTTDSKIIRKQIINVQGGVADHLKLGAGGQVLFLETLRSVDTKPFCLISHYLPFPKYERVFEQYHGGSLHLFLENYFGIKLQRKQSLISTALPEAEDARVLNMPKNLPVLRVKSVNVSQECQTPVEYVVTRFRGDAAQLSVQP